MSKTIKIKLSSTIAEKLETLEQSLIAKGIKTLDKSHIVNSALLSMKASFWDSIESDLTPFEFKLKLALTDEKKRKEIEKLLKGMNKVSSLET